MRRSGVRCECVRALGKLFCGVGGGLVKDGGGGVLCVLFQRWFVYFRWRDGYTERAGGRWKEIE